MIDKKLNQRQEFILSNIETDRAYAIGEVGKFFIEKNKISLATLRRDLKSLNILGFLDQTGKLKSTLYTLTTFGMFFNPIDPHDYCTIEADKRKGSSKYNFSLFNQIPKNILSIKEITKLTDATKFFIQKSKNASKIIEQKELERFVIELSWKSSKIEGNTYTLLDTELLLREGIEAKGHTKNEAIEILNHKKAFQYILFHKNSYLKLDLRIIEDIHRLLIEGLGVSFGLRSKPVGIIGTKYIPLSIPSQIQEALTNLNKAIEQLETPYEKALLALLGISYIQPFEDGNKRTARLVANAILLAHNCAPLSYRSVDEINYRESILVFYEKNSILPVCDIFIEQYIFSCENYLKF